MSANPNLPIAEKAHIRLGYLRLSDLHDGRQLTQVLCPVAPTNGGGGQNGQPIY